MIEQNESDYYGCWERLQGLLCRAGPHDSFQTRFWVLPHLPSCLGRRWRFVVNWGLWSGPLTSKINIQSAAIFAYKPKERVDGDDYVTPWLRAGWLSLAFLLLDCIDTDIKASSDCKNKNTTKAKDLVEVGNETAELDLSSTSGSPWPSDKQRRC